MKIPIEVNKYGMITVRIYSEDGRVVRNLAHKNITSRKMNILWNGKDTKDKIVKDGTYIVKVIMVDKNNKKASRQKKIEFRGVPVELKVTKQNKKRLQPIDLVLISSSNKNNYMKTAKQDKNLGGKYLSETPFYLMTPGREYPQQVMRKEFQKKWMGDYKTLSANFFLYYSFYKTGSPATIVMVNLNEVKIGKY
ncbi:hypothetical protein LLY41_02735 [Cytobacillus firmus]|uniref:hypothetical protein n=1 Tax=Cytobacillus firmus TaxID=1399 RepID=UPI00218BDF2D|nr:hypothetical protein [Cytobacillus firmus]URM33417.1 hypothetical protein LLY41_02735 [Cytobacillus firmus]